MTTRTHRDARGFTLLEMVVVILIFGIMMGFAVPALLRLNRTLTLKGTVTNLANQVQLARQKAIATATPQIVNFSPGAFDANLRVYSGTNPQPTTWKFPKGVSYDWTGGLTVPFQMIIVTPDGRSDRTGYVVLQMTPGGLRDTVYIQRSGMVIVQ